MEAKCITCRATIPAERLEALPGTQHCVSCSVERPRIVPVDGVETDDLIDAVTCQDGSW